MKYLLPAVSAIILILIVGGTAFYLGTKSINPQSQTLPTPTNTQIETAKSQSTPTPTLSQTKIVSAGGVLSFPAYSLELPQDWTSERVQGQDSDKLTLTRQGYKITIFEAAFGGSQCLYPGNPPAEMAQIFSSFVQISNSNGFMFRRGPSQGISNSWAVCQKNASDGSFGAPTIFGHINITTPANSDSSILSQADSILASLKKI